MYIILVIVFLYLSYADLWRCICPPPPPTIVCLQYIPELVSFLALLVSMHARLIRPLIATHSLCLRNSFGDPVIYSSFLHCRDSHAYINSVLQMVFKAISQVFFVNSIFLINLFLRRNIFVALFNLAFFLLLCIFIYLFYFWRKTLFLGTETKHGSRQCRIRRAAYRLKPAFCCSCYCYDILHHDDGQSSIEGAYLAGGPSVLLCLYL